MLRNESPVDDYSTVIALLDAYPYHLVGQPLAIRYWKNEEHTETSVVLAIGIKNYTDAIGNDEVAFGPEFYRIIGSEEGKINWEELENGNLEKTEATFRVAQMTPDEFNEWVENALPNVVTFVQNASGTGRIYKGGTYYGTTDINDLTFGSDTVIGDSIISAGSSITQLAEHIVNNAGTRWNTLFEE